MRDQRDRRAGRLRRVLVCAAAVPVVFVAAGCSSDSGSDGSGSGGTGQSASTDSSKGSTSASPTVQAARYHKLPGACGALSKKTLGELIPEGSKSGKEGTSDDIESRASCSWNSLDSNGVKGSQFRWLNVSLLRFDSDVSRGSGESQAKAYYTKQVQGAQGVTGAKNSKSVPVSGVGNEAMAVRYDLKKKEGSFKQTTVVARVENVVITLDYNGAGLAGEKTPDATELTRDAEKATKEVVAAVTSANGTNAGTTKPSPSQSASKAAGGSSSKTASASPSKSASKKS
ncbi:DUF3558 family protein [Streptomyces sp. HUAS TT20]|uniref:DUF3558 family protein n=1 Tax=Streptomyces sp. HUAS TT20 TaxID=3447509 RepID=UPI0021D98989|nr:DUF3558 family protein [Streptomyces sp. HUAS 15-9]UXY29100.1 DUF3558 family protein [Streptomyces sp. HUAS 15-9]